MPRICGKCRADLFKCYDCRVFFTMKCPVCKARFTQHKRLPKTKQAAA